MIDNALMCCLCLVPPVEMKALLGPTHILRWISKSQLTANKMNSLVWSDWGDYSRLLFYCNVQRPPTSWYSCSGDGWWFTWKQTSIWNQFAPNNLLCEKKIRIPKKKLQTSICKWPPKIQSKSNLSNHRRLRPTSQSKHTVISFGRNQFVKREQNSPKWFNFLDNTILTSNRNPIGKWASVYSPRKANLTQTNLYQ